MRTFACSLLIRKIDEGGLIRRGWGVAWRDYRGGPASVTLMPLPLNLVVGFVRKLYFRALFGIYPHRIEITRDLLKASHRREQLLLNRIDLLMEQLRIDREIKQMLVNEINRLTVQNIVENSGCDTQH